VKQQQARLAPVLIRTFSFAGWRTLFPGSDAKFWVGEEPFDLIRAWFEGMGQHTGQRVMP